GEVEYAEPNYQVKPASLPASSGLVPNDPQFWNQWALNNPGFNVAGYPSTNGADIKATEAWQITTGNPDVLVAITDTGVDITHPDLAPNIYTNPGEIAGNGIDDDHNGYVDDVTGFDVADNNGDVSDVLGHGTEMAGIIGAVLNNRIGISGICQCKMVPVKFFKKTGPDPTDVAATVADAAKAIIYSITIGASIINASGDVMFEPGTFSPGEPKALRDAVSACNDADVLLVCIAGNDGLSTDINAVYPGHYELPNQIVVAASDYNDDLWHVLGLPSELKSNFGVNTVQIAAPGNLVLTTEAPGDCPLCTQSPDPNSWYTSIDGSSASAAYVSGVAALAKSLFPEANAPVLRRRILESADSIPQLTPYVSNGNRLNALGAVTIQLQITPPVLKKAKYKVSRQVLVLSGTSIQRGAHAIIGGTVYATVPTPGTIVPLQVSLPASVFPSGVAIPVVLRNPDGGTSQTLTITR
ncbi:MAG: S8 family serine peptidase, partial [Blastocatellia bacterium]